MPAKCGRSGSMKTFSRFDVNDGSHQGLQQSILIYRQLKVPRIGTWRVGGHPHSSIYSNEWGFRVKITEIYKHYVR